MVDLIDTIVYAGRLKDKSALMSSSSGGAFTALSDAFLKARDAVVAAITVLGLFLLPLVLGIGRKPLSKIIIV